jgi:hypothetical protein
VVDVGHELELAWLHRERQHDERERETTRREEEPPTCGQASTT